MWGIECNARIESNTTTLLILVSLASAHGDGRTALGMGEKEDEKKMAVMSDTSTEANQDSAGRLDEK
jgi:hypothetical protein